MEKVDEKNVKKQNKDFDETRVIGNLKEIVKENKVKKEPENRVVSNQILQKSIKPKVKDTDAQIKLQNKNIEPVQNNPKKPIKKEENKVEEKPKTLEKPNTR